MPLMVADLHALDALVRRTRWHLRLGAVYRGLAWTVVVASVCWSLVALLDLLWPCVGPWVRLLGLIVASVGPLGLLGWQVIRPLGQPWPTVAVAQRIESHVPNIQARLVSCLHLADQPEHLSSAFFRKLVAETSTYVRSFHPSVVIDRIAQTRAVYAAVAGVVLFLGLWVGFGTAFTTALARIAAPFADVPPYSRTTFTVEPGTATLLRGETMAVRIAVSGEVPTRLAVELSGTGTTLRYELDPDANTGNTVWRTELLNLSSVRGLENGFTYRIFGGGTWSVAQQITWTDRPVVSEVRGQVVFPVYLSGTRSLAPPEMDADGPIGSHVELTATTSRDVVRAWVQLNPLHTHYHYTRLAPLGYGVREEPTALPSERLPLVRSDAMQWRGSFLLVGRGTYEIVVENEAGYTNTRPYDPPRYQALPDEPPTVRMEKPSSDVYVQPMQPVPVQISVRDDHGLRDVVLLVALGEGPLTPLRTLKTYSVPTRTDVLTTEVLLPTGNTLRYCVAVRDAHPTRAPTRSAVYTLWRALDPNDPAANPLYLAEQGQQTATELDELKNFLQGLREKLQQRHGQQQDLADQTEQAADKDIPDHEKKQATFDELLRKDLDLTKKILEREKAKRTMPDDPKRPDVPEAKAEPMSTPNKKDNPTKSDATPTDRPKDMPPSFAPALSGDQQKLDPKTAPKLTYPKRDRRDALRQHQKDNLNALESAQQALQSDEATLEKMIRELLDASAATKQNPQQGRPPAKELMKLLQGANLQDAKQMAQRAKQAQNRTSGQASSQAATTGQRSTDGNALGLPQSLDDFDPPTRAAILQLPPRVREELLQGMKAQGPEGYQKFIQDYFRRLADVAR